MSALEKAAGQGKDSHRGPQAATEVGEERSQFRGTRERIGTLAAFVVDVRFEQIPGIRPGPLSLSFAKSSSLERNLAGRIGPSSKRVHGPCRPQWSSAAYDPPLWAPGGNA